MSDYKVVKLARAADIEASAWNSCANPHHQPYNPFLDHAFFVAAEESGAASAETGWMPCHLTLQGSDETYAILPLYLKSHSQGEYVFDHGWADAFDRAGGQYYPKLLSAVPFTPATGHRLLIASTDQIRRADCARALLRAAEMLVTQYNLSSLHVNFLPKLQWHFLGDEGYLLRKDQQFHWQNDGYSRFDDFLDALSSRKRKAVRKERQRALENGITVECLTGPALQAQHWDMFYSFYMDTGMRKYGRPYLNRAFFSALHDTMGDHVLLIMAKREGRYIAGALNFIGEDTLFGRNWGCLEDHPFLHFEVCYYQAIDFAIAHGLKRVEAGAQGAHKIARGYLPCPTYSAHYIAHEGLRQAVKTYLDSERDYVDGDITALSQYTPFKRDAM